MKFINLLKVHYYKNKSESGSRSLDQQILELDRGGLTREHPSPIDIRTTDANTLKLIVPPKQFLDNPNENKVVILSVNKIWI